MKKLFFATVALCLLAGFAGSASAQSNLSKTSGELGSIQFPTSAKGEAQTAFLTGVKALHNFEFDQAADA